MSTDNRKVLVFGITGNLGLHFADAAEELGITLHAFVRPGSAQASDAKQQRVRGCVLHEGDIHDSAAVAAAMKDAYAVISLLGSANLHHQVDLVKAAKEAGVTRFIPSEFSCHLNAPESVETLHHAHKMETRKAIQDAGLEFTCIQSNGFMQWFAPACFNMLGPEYPERVVVYDGGNSKIGLTHLLDVARVTLRAVLDPRCANKFVVVSFPGTLYTQNEMIDLWEKLSGTKVERVPMSAEEVISEKERFYQDPTKKLEAITLHVVQGYVVRRLATCEKREGELLAAELYAGQFKHTTLEEFYQAIVDKHKK